MTLNEYQQSAYTFAAYRDPIYPVLALGEECGELQKIYAKFYRGDTAYDCPTERKMKVKKELGDILWMLAAIAKEEGFDLDDVAVANISKLQARKVNDTLKGDGDDR